MSGIEKIAKIEKIIKVGRALENDDITEVAILLGLTPDLTDTMSVTDIFDAMTIRMSDLIREVKGE